MTLFNDNLVKATDIGYKVIEILENLSKNPLAVADPVDRDLLRCINYLAEQNVLILRELNYIRMAKEKENE